MIQIYSRIHAASQEEKSNDKAWTFSFRCTPYGYYDKSGLFRAWVVDQRVPEAEIAEEES
jgi:hypothetical protein